MSMDFNDAGPRRKDNDQVRDLFDDRHDFQMLLDDAGENASTPREEDFIAGLQDKFDQYGMRMYISDRQLSWLRALANGD